MHATSRALLKMTALLAVCAASAFAGPVITNVSPRGLQSGATTTLTISGNKLLPVPKLLMALSGVQQVVRPGGTNRQVQIDVTLDEKTPAGFHQLRVANDAGVSPPLVISIDALTQRPLADATTLPMALYGSISGAELARTSFEGKAGQPFVADVEARRLGSRLNPVVRLYDSRDVQIAYAQTDVGLGGDARLDVRLPADGKYTVEVHDALYKGAGGGYFRLKLGDLHYADLAYPLGVQKATPSSISFASSNLPPDAKVELNQLTPASSVPVQWPTAEGLVGGQPWVVVSNLVEVLEGQTSGPIRVPAAINGRLMRAGEEDRFTLEVAPGMKLQFDMLAARAGSAVDGVISIRNPQGGQLANADDRANTKDPILDFTVPAGVKQIVLAVKDLAGRGGPSCVYRVAVTDARQPDFELTVQEDRIEIPQGGSTLVRVQAKRSAYDGPIRLAVEGLPAGVTLSGAEIPAGGNDCLVSFSASELSPAQMLVRLIGQSPDGSIERVAEFPETAATRTQPWLSTQLAAAVTPAAPLQVVWDKVSTEGALSLGGSLQADVRAVRHGKAKGPVRLSLITTQIVPTKNVNNKQEEDLDRALRLDGSPTITDDQTQAIARILVPGDLPITSYDLAIKAELLSADNKVLATALTPARRFQPVKPSFSLELTGEKKVEAISGAGPTGKLVGKLVRSAGFDQNVVLAFSGLPKGVVSPEHIVTGDRSDFEFPVTFAMGVPAGELGGVKLVATSQLNSKTKIKADNDIAVALKIVAGSPVVPEHPQVLFEDQPEFVSSLVAGAGATLATDVKYSGTASVRVKPVQQGLASLPGMNVKIRQYPGPGEYRYLRFVWRKEGGRNICLQLGHDGKFGPMPGSRSTFRYHAGIGPECFGASEAITKDLPREFTVVTRDLFADFGEFTLTGLGLSPVDGSVALFDHIYLARKPDDFMLVAPK